MRLSMNEALNKVRQIRPIVAPNLIFMSQLSDYETRILGQAKATAMADENAKPTLEAEAAESSTPVKAQTQTQNVNTKPMLLLADETNDQIRKKADEMTVTAATATEPIGFSFDDFSSSNSSSSASSSDDAEDDDTSCNMAGGMRGHHKNSHHNANEVLVCN